MKQILLITFIFSLSLFFCQAQEENNDSETQKKRPSALEGGKFFEADGKKMLYGGQEDAEHFDITDYELKDEQFHYGIGREAFPAILEPEFISVEEADTIWEEDARFLVAFKGNDVKAYSIEDLTRHEVVNDELDGQPIMAAYCILADLGAIYERNYGTEELTFALSGYTYYDPEVWEGLDGFILWDRETESLWWPLIGRAVSGDLQGTKLLEMDKAHWEDVTWKVVKEKYPTAQVLQSGQDYERPKNWEKEVDIDYIIDNFKQ